MNRHLRAKLGHRILRLKTTGVSDCTKFDFVSYQDLNTKTADFLAKANWERNKITQELTADFYFHLNFNFRMKLHIDICFYIITILGQFRKTIWVKLKLEDIKLHTIFANVMVVNYGEDDGEEDRAPLVRAQ